MSTPNTLYNAMHRKTILYLLLTASVIASFAPAKKIGVFDVNSDIGAPKLPGSATYDKTSKVYTLKGSGYNIWFERDEFQFLYKELHGDFTLTADFEFDGSGVDAHRKVGWMVRESLYDNASHVSAVLHGDGLTVLQWRVKKGDKMRDPEDEIFSAEKNVKTVQLRRKGKEYTMMAAKKGAPLQPVGAHVMHNLPDKIIAGLFICSHNPDVLETARVSNVQVIRD
ncbi:hypothetical protein [Dyadobacter sp. LHD-138]|uniref:hypothetical protein n=1 Tax=Dyadobacter sp. LHD-138 TaxID=3071413 RepID=UPI0027E1513A|nr:hypothetical protein [Dyadobacter sp. LHD-138]MDQ6477973.1 hypothetical protein [Dyadobacter sp. LHD-138]